MSEKRYLDGPGFVDWLASERSIFHTEGGATGQLRSSLFTPSGTRAINRWRVGARVDTILSRAFEDVLDALDLQMWEIPEELYRLKKNHKWRPGRDLVMRLRHEEGMSLKGIARHTGSSVETIKYLLSGVE